MMLFGKRTKKTDVSKVRIATARDAKSSESEGPRGAKISNQSADCVIVKDGPTRYPRHSFTGILMRQTVLHIVLVDTAYRVKRITGFAEEILGSGQVPGFHGRHHEYKLTPSGPTSAHIEKWF